MEQQDTVETMLRKQLLKEQVELNDSVLTTAQLLRFILDISNENLQVIQEKLLKIKDLSSTISQQAAQDAANDNRKQ